MKKRVILIGAACSGVALIGLYFWWTHRSSSTQYQTLPATRGSIQHTITASGTVNPVTTIQVGTYVSGVIQTLSCDFNTRVKAGQRCAKIDPRPYQTIVDEESAALATARAQQAKDEANLAFAKLIYDRDIDLLHNRIVSQETVDAARNAYDQARAQVEFDKASVAQHAATLHAANVNLDYTNILSPVDGTVVSRNVTQGQTVAASFQTPTLFLIATDLTQMQVDTNVSESDIGNVRVGKRALFTVEAYPDRSFTGSVVQVRQAPQSVQNVITYDVVVGVSNQDLRLMPGMTAAVRIVIDERADVLRVPDQALRFVPKDAALAAKGNSSAGSAHVPTASGVPTQRTSGAVWRLQNGKPVRVPIDLGLGDDAHTEVLAGDLTPGEQVIVGETNSTASAPRMPRM